MASMAGGRQVCARLTLFAMSLTVTVLAAGLATGLLDPSGARYWAGATLLTSALLGSVRVLQLVIARLVTPAAQPPAGDVDAAPAPLIRAACPDAPGRPRPRAPGSVAAARPA